MGRYGRMRTRTRRGASGLVALATVSSLVACSPAMNWRQVRSDDSPLQVLMPCKPDRASRRIRIRDQELTWQLLSCEANGATWSLAYGGVESPDQVGPVLADLQDMAVANWAVTQSMLEKPPGASTPASTWPPGATPQPNAARWTSEGRRPDGQSLPVQAAWFAQGLTVYQLAVLGKTAPTDAETWWSSVTVVR